MTDEVKVTMSARAVEHNLQPPWDDDDPHLFVRCQSNEDIEMFIHWGGQHMAGDDNDVFSGKLRWDDKPAIDARFSESTSNEATFLKQPQPLEFLNQAKESNQVYLRVRDHAGISHDALFKLYGFEAVLGDNSDLCLGMSSSGAGLTVTPWNLINPGSKGGVRTQAIDYDFPHHHDEVPPLSVSCFLSSSHLSVSIDLNDSTGWNALFMELMIDDLTESIVQFTQRGTNEKITETFHWRSSNPGDEYQSYAIYAEVPNRLLERLKEASLALVRFRDDEGNKIEMTFNVDGLELEMAQYGLACGRGS